MVHFLQRISSVAELLGKRRVEKRDEEGQRSRVHFKEEAAISVRPPP